MNPKSKSENIQSEESKFLKYISRNFKGDDQSDVLEEERNKSVSLTSIAKNSNEFAQEKQCIKCKNILLIKEICSRHEKECLTGIEIRAQYEFNCGECGKNFPLKRNLRHH